jgi:HAD superfamily hydrolase (TIGR01450 family)
MFAVILAAGIGSRLRPITYEAPKCMTSVYGITILERQVLAFQSAGIKDLVIVTGYRSSDIQTLNLPVRYKDIHFTFIENNDYEITNNMYSLYLTSSIVEGSPFFLCNGDVIFDSKIVQDMQEDQQKSLIAVDRNNFLEESMKVTVNQDTFITNIAKSIPKNEAHSCSIDLYKFSGEDSSVLFSELREFIEVEQRLKEWTEVALQRLFQTNRLNMRTFDIGNNKWVEIDDFNDLLQADIKFSNISTENFEQKTFFIDLDGTLFIGDNLIPGADLFIQLLEEKGVSYYLFSNNSSYSKKSLSQKLKGIGIFVNESKILLSTDGVIHFLKERDIYKLFVVGTNNMKESLTQAGFEVESESPDFVLLGYDTELNYEKIKTASYYLNKGVPLLATHCDVNCPTIDGPIPDIGSMLIMFETALNIKPYKVFGKPNPEMISSIIGNEKNDYTNKLVVIGDRLYTDMKLARNVGADFICVLSGETKRADMHHSQDYPDLIISSVANLLSYME